MLEVTIMGNSDLWWVIYIRQPKCWILFRVLSRNVWLFFSLRTSGLYIQRLRDNRGNTSNSFSLLSRRRRLRRKVAKHFCSRCCPCCPCCSSKNVTATKDCCTDWSLESTVHKFIKLDSLGRWPFNTFKESLEPLVKWTACPQASRKGTTLHCTIGQ